MMDLREIQTERISVLRESARQDALRASGIDPDIIRWDHPDFSVKQLREATTGRMREASAESSFPALLRAGVQQFMFDAYQTVPTIYQDLVRTVSSNKYEELYAPLYNSELPQEVLPSEPFPDSRIIGLDVHVRNRKWGRIIGFERELVDDDQTGQISQRAANLGELMRYIEELQVMSALVNATDNTPGATSTVAGSAYNTTVGNTPGTPGKLSQPTLESASIGLENMVDPLGNFLLVMPDTILVSPADRYNVLKLINSTLQPSVPGAANQNVTTVAGGTTGWTMTINPLQGEFSAKISRFLPGSSTTQGGPGLKGPGLDAANGAWFLMQTKKSLVFQDREALEVVQENPTGGTAFSVDQYRYRLRRRFNTNLIEGRFVWRGN